MDTHCVNIVDCFPGKQQYIIPLFQRMYVWKKDNWKMLWEDIMSYYNEDDNSITDAIPHFMGAVVSIPVNTIPAGIKKYMIIDGQQRLLTISVLLCAIRDCNESEADGIQYEYIENKKYNETSERFKMCPTQGDRDAFYQIASREIPQERGKGKHPLLECYSYFKEQLRGGDENEQPISSKKILDIIEKLLQVVVINLGDADDPYMIFESLNSKGEALKSTDLIRNYILMQFKHSAKEGGEQEKIYKEYWCPLSDMLGNSLDKFFYHYTTKEKRRKVVEKRTYSEVKSLLKKLEGDALLEKLKAIRRNAEYYSRFLTPQKEGNPHIQAHLWFIMRLGVTPVYSLLLKVCDGVHSGRVSEAEYARFLAILVSYLARVYICKGKTNFLNSLIPMLLANIEKKDLPLDVWLEQELLSCKGEKAWQNDESFKQSIMTRIVPANQSLFLWEIERKLAGKECISYDSTTLEHIMPQTLNDEWRDSLGDNADDIHDRCLGLLGNLSLTKTNSELSNHAFAEKKTMYQKSGFKLNCELANHFDCWGEEEIKKRGEWLAEQAIRVWKYPERNTGIITKIGLEMTWTSRNPVRLYIDNNETFVSLWKEVFIKILDYMFHIDKESFLFFAKQKGSWLIVDNDESYHLAEKSHSAEDMRKFVLKACEHMTIPVETFTVGVTK